MPNLINDETSAVILQLANKTKAVYDEAERLSLQKRTIKPLQDHYLDNFHGDNRLTPTQFCKVDWLWVRAYFVRRYAENKRADEIANNIKNHTGGDE